MRFFPDDSKVHSSSGILENAVKVEGTTIVKPNTDCKIKTKSNCLYLYFHSRFVDARESAASIKGLKSAKYYSMKRYAENNELCGAHDFFLSFGVGVRATIKASHLIVERTEKGNGQRASSDRNCLRKNKFDSVAFQVVVDLASWNFLPSKGGERHWGWNWKFLWMERNCRRFPRNRSFNFNSSVERKSNKIGFNCEGIALRDEGAVQKDPLCCHFGKQWSPNRFTSWRIVTSGQSCFIWWDETFGQLDSALTLFQIRFNSTVFVRPLEAIKTPQITPTSLRVKLVLLKPFSDVGSSAGLSKRKQFRQIPVPTALHNKINQLKVSERHFGLS